jgi:hypothetical protein
MTQRAGTEAQGARPHEAARARTSIHACDGGTHYRRRQAVRRTLSLCTLTDTARTSKEAS